MGLNLGHWRSWLARFHGMEEVKGSNPLCSTKFTLKKKAFRIFRVLNEIADDKNSTSTSVYALD